MPASRYTYEKKFFEYLRLSSGRSARVIVPLVMKELGPRSILDVGCGAGAWIAEYLEQGVIDALGTDGDYVRPEMLLVPRERFRQTDVGAPFELGRKFDLVQCLEVAEHLPVPSAGVLIQNLARHGDRVLFSAAVPGQGGENHVNERPLEYWREQFAEQGYAAYDFLRPLLEKQREVEPWYRYNTVLYVRQTAAQDLPPSVRAGEAGERLAEFRPLGYRLRCAAVRMLPTPVATAVARVKHRLLARRPGT